jgi:uncharacterized membrane protein (DUF4010 family)
LTAPDDRKMMEFGWVRKEIIVLELPLTRLAIALAIGLLIGLERGWSARTEKEGERAAGIRTHAISGLLGGVTALLSEVTTPYLIGFAFVAFSGVTALFHWMQSRDEHQFSATGAVAGMLAFMLGAYAILGDPEIAVSAATATVVLLALRSTLHQWIARLEWIEIRAVLILVTMSFLLLPFLPDHTLDPWGTLNPARIWELAIFVCALSFIGYIAIRVFGERYGFILAAISGGVVSSTAATLNFARIARANPSQTSLMAGSIALAGAVMSLRILVIVAVLNMALLTKLWPVLVMAAAVQGGSGIILILAGTRVGEHRIEWKNPFDLPSALQFAGFIALVILLSSLAARHFGASGVIGLAMLSGLADVDAITLALARQQEPPVDVTLAAYAILLAAAVNSLVKIGIAGWSGGSATGWRSLIAGGGAILASGLVLLILSV